MSQPPPPGGELGNFISKRACKVAGLNPHHHNPLPQPLPVNSIAPFTREQREHRVISQVTA